MSSKHQRGLTWLGHLLHLCGLAPILIGGMVYWIVVFQVYGAADREQMDRIREYETIIGQAPDIDADFEEVKTGLRETEQGAADARQRIPVDPREAEFLREVSQLTHAESIVIRDYSRGEIVTQDKVSQLGVRLVIEGEFASFCRFLDQLEALPRITRIQTLTISNPQDLARYPFELNIVLYFTAA